MSTSAPSIAIPQVRQASSVKMIATLGTVSTISGVLLVLVYLGTFDIIAENKRKALEEAVFTVLPGAVERATYAVSADGFTPIQGDTKDTDVVYAGYDESGKLVGVAITAAGQGYQDIISILFGYDPVTESVIGYKLLGSKETPGLGDKIGKDESFLASFRKLDVSLNSEGSGLKNAIEVIKDGKNKDWQIDGISGATISSKAVGAMLNTRCSQILPIVRKHVDQLQKVTP
ncbi:MAG: electron transport complex subunit G [Candidatus Hydrogenedentota bacterium]